MSALHRRFLHIDHVMCCSCLEKIGTVCLFESNPGSTPAASGIWRRINRPFRHGIFVFRFPFWMLICIFIVPMIARIHSVFGSAPQGQGLKDVKSACSPRMIQHIQHNWLIMIYQHLLAKRCTTTTHCGSQNNWRITATASPAAIYDWHLGPFLAQCRYHDY